MSTTHKTLPRTWPTEQLETHDDRSKREHAAFVLQSRDHLWWYANAMNSTLPQTRLHFTKILSGLDPSHPPAKYTSVRPGSGILPPSQRTNPPPEQTKRRERASLGTGEGKGKERRSDGASRRVNGVVEGSGGARRVSGRVQEGGDVEMTTTPSRASPRARASPRIQGQGQVGRSVGGSARRRIRESTEPEFALAVDAEVEVELADEVDVDADADVDGGVRIE